MTVYGKPGKRSCCFPSFTQTLEIDEADSHIPTATTTTTRINISSTRLVMRYAFRGQGQPVPSGAKNCFNAFHLHYPTSLRYCNILIGDALSLSSFGTPNMGDHMYFNAICHENCSLQLHLSNLGSIFPSEGRSTYEDGSGAGVSRRGLDS